MTYPTTTTKHSTDLLQLVLMRAIPPALLNDVHVQAQTLEHVDPEVAELPILEGHHLHSQELTSAKHAAHRAVWSLPESAQPTTTTAKLKCSCNIKSCGIGETA